jgi:hypothetical protein
VTATETSAVTLLRSKGQFYSVERVLYASSMHAQALSFVYLESVHRYLLIVHITSAHWNGIFSMSHRSSIVQWNVFSLS